MATIINHDIRCVDGKYIQMPIWVPQEPTDEGIWGNLKLPNPLANSGTGDAVQQYPTGTKFVCGDRIFRYVYVSTVDAQDRTGIALNNISESATGTTANITWGAAGSVPGDEIVGLVTTGFVDTTPALNDFAGGWLVPPYPQPYGTFMVMSSTLSTAGARTAGEIDLTLDYPLINTVAAGTNYGELNYSEYVNVARGWSGEYGNFASYVGVTLIISEATSWQWVQTYGPCYMSMDGAVGGENDERLVAFGDGGSVYLQASYTNKQIAGYMLPSTGVAGTATSLVFLTLKS